MPILGPPLLKLPHIGEIVIASIRPASFSVRGDAVALDVF